jgi:hypothetical protein
MLDVKGKEIVHGDTATSGKKIFDIIIITQYRKNIHKKEIGCRG